MDIFETEFQTSVRIVNNFTNRNQNFKNTSIFKKLYGLYKQSLFGDNKTSCPYFFELNSKEKWKSWMNEVGKDKINAKKEYVELVTELLNSKHIEIY
jgi:acyl-CoA-binding protein